MAVAAAVINQRAHKSPNQIKKKMLQDIKSSTSGKALPMKQSSGPDWIELNVWLRSISLLILQEREKSPDSRVREAWMSS